MTRNLSQEIRNTPHEKVMTALWANLKDEKLTYPGIDNFIGWGLMQWIMIDIHYGDYKLTEPEYFEIAKFAAQKWPHEILRVHDDKLSVEHFYNVMTVAFKASKDDITKNNIRRRMEKYLENVKSTMPAFANRTPVYNMAR
jgi:hypothetical protein